MNTIGWKVYFIFLLLLDFFLLQIREMVGEKQREWPVRKRRLSLGCQDERRTIVAAKKPSVCVR
jgi:hypothetical protein